MVEEMNGDKNMFPNYRQFPGPPPSLSIDSLSSSSFSNSSSSSSPSSIWSSTFGSKHGLSLSLADLFLSNRSPIATEDGTFFGVRRRYSSSSSPSPSSQLDSYSLRRRASTLAAALGLSSPRQFFNSSSSSSSSNSILSESEVRRRLLAVGAKPNGQNGGKLRGRSVGIGTDGGGGGNGLGKDFGPTNPNRGKGTSAGGVLVRHFPANGGPIRHSHPWPNLTYSNPFRVLLANNARSLPALFGVAIDFSGIRAGKGTTKHFPKPMTGEGGELVRKRSFSRKSMLVPDRVPAGRRRSSVIVSRRARPNLQAKIVAGKKAIQLQKKQKQMEGQKKQEIQQRTADATKMSFGMPKGLSQKSAKQRINVDWTHVPRLKLKFLDKKENFGKERKKVAIKEAIGQEMKEKGAKSPVDGNGKKQQPPKGILQIKGKSLENAKIDGTMVKQMNSSVGGKSPKMNQKVMGKFNRRKLKPSIMAWRQSEPLIQPLDRTKMGKSRALKPILTPKSPPSKGAQNPPMNKQFLTGKAPDLFSKPIFLDSPKLMRNFGGIRLGN